ncbi:MAG: 2-amino-4-hydroxy-6-hydroxymethyldihydropteridine diphosphokinase [Spongiibacteraceae bacterium]
MTRSFVALGSNLEEPLAQLRQAFLHLQRLPLTELLRCSPLYQNPAIGPGAQPDYLNAVVELFTELSPHELLAELQLIETRQGRRREQHWGARTLDLDLLLYGDNNIDTADLQVPHRRMLQRNFVLYPLYDIAPDLLLPDGSPLRRHLDSCSSAGLIQTPLAIQA